MILSRVYPQVSASLKMGGQARAVVRRRERGKLPLPGGLVRGMCVRLALVVMPVSDRPKQHLCLIAWRSLPVSCLHPQGQSLLSP